MARILLVEDNEPNRDMLQRRLARRGFEVKSVENGMQALAAAGSESFDVILMDLRLPDISGWDVTRQLRSQSNNKTLKIIALTAHAMEGDRQAALDAGCDDYDTKPIDMVRLVDKINGILAAPQTGSDSTSRS